MVMDDARGKAIFFTVVAGIIGISFTADFYFRNTVFYRIQQICFWPAALALVIFLLRGKMVLRPGFSRCFPALFLILSGGLFLRLYNISALPLNHDEAHTTLRTLYLFQNNYFVSYAGMPVAFLKGKVPALFPLLVTAAAWRGSSPEIIARLPAVAIGILTIYLTYRLAKELSGKKAALAAAFFLAVFPWHIIQSRVGVSVVLTPCCGVLFFLLFIKAVKKQDYRYLYLSFLTLGIAAFWTYTESQVFIILAPLLCVVLRKELSWVRPVDMLSCLLLFLLTLYPFLPAWDKAGFIQSQYYHSVGLQGNLAFGIFQRLKEALRLLFWEKNQFFLFAPGLKGPIIQFCLWLPLALGILNARKGKILAAVLTVWLLGGVFFCICFVREVADRYFIAIAPAIAILFGAGIALNRSKKVALLCAAAALAGCGIYLNNYFGYLHKLPLESLKVYSYGSKEIADFLSREPDFMRPDSKTVIEWRMSPVGAYFVFGGRKTGSPLELSFLNKFTPYWEGEFPVSPQTVYYCLWSPESRANDWDAFNCGLYKKFKLRFPEKNPVKTIYYPDGEKAIEIFKAI